MEHDQTAVAGTSADTGRLQRRSVAQSSVEPKSGQGEIGSAVGLARADRDDLLATVLPLTGASHRLQVDLEFILGIIDLIATLWNHRDQRPHGVSKLLFGLAIAKRTIPDRLLVDNVGILLGLHD